MNELIADVREHHAMSGDCQVCQEPSPCMPIRLADELERAERDRDEVKSQASGKVVGYMLYADSPFDEAPFTGQSLLVGNSLTGSVMPGTEILDQSVSGWQKVNPSARVVVVSEMPVAGDPS